jgi:ABC-2 type transport system permease protein
LKGFLAFLKKEFMETSRSGRVYLALFLYVFFGIFNPAMAKLTPLLYQSFSSSLKEQGITITKVTINAMTSWQQYYKNVPMELLVFLLLFSGILTNECQKGTLVLMVTKGLNKATILAAKSIALLFTFSICYWLSFLITYGYNAYFWDNSIASHVVGSACLPYVFGIFLIALTIFYSVFASSALNVLLGVGGTLFVLYIANLFLKVKKLSPFTLFSGLDILAGKTKFYDVQNGVILTILFSVILWTASFFLFQRKKLSL